VEDIGTRLSDSDGRIYGSRMSWCLLASSRSSSVRSRSRTGRREPSGVRLGGVEDGQLPGRSAGARPRRSGPAGQSEGDHADADADLQNGAWPRWQKVVDVDRVHVPSLLAAAGVVLERGDLVEAPDPAAHWSVVGRPLSAAHRCCGS
jgi:hypothetical protein